VTLNLLLLHIGVLGSSLPLQVAKWDQSFFIPLIVLKIYLISILQLKVAKMRLKLQYKEEVDSMSLDCMQLQFDVIS
jgi:hypothetical protein